MHYNGAIQFDGGRSVHEDILDSLVAAVLRLDAADRVEYLNPAAATLLETSPRHARGRRLAELLPVDETLAAYVGRARRHGEPLALAEIDLAVGPPPGRQRQVRCDILPLDGGAVQIECQLRDTRQLLAQETGASRNRRLPQPLVQALAHEIKNPLSGLRGAAQLLATETSDPAHREYLDVMLRETARLRDLVDGMLGPARPPRFLALNIHEVLEHVSRLLVPEHAGITWQRDYDPSLPELRGDPDQLTQVFLNLAANACEAFDGKEGCILLRTRIEREHVVAGSQRLAIRVDVEDNGPGIPPALGDSLFLPLVTGRADGTGLGLPIAQEIVQRHGGSIAWRSGAGRTVFSVVLPLDGTEPGETSR